MYPRLTINGFLGYAASDLSELFTPRSTLAFILPTVQWNVLNYGRILNNINVQDARFQQFVLQYQQTVLRAGREVEDALVGFIQAQQQAARLEASVREAEAAVQLVVTQYEGGVSDINRLFNAQSTLVNQQDQLATARGSIALNLIQVFRALGGGWEYMRCGQCKPNGAPFIPMPPGMTAPRAESIAPGEPVKPEPPAVEDIPATEPVEPSGEPMPETHGPLPQPRSAVPPKALPPAPVPNLPAESAAPAVESSTAPADSSPPPADPTPPPDPAAPPPPAPTVPAKPSGVSRPSAPWKPPGSDPALNSSRSRLTMQGRAPPVRAAASRRGGASRSKRPVAPRGQLCRGIRANA